MDKTITTLLFDLDGTLVDTEKLDDDVMRRVLHDKGIPMDKAFHGCTLDEYVKGIEVDRRLGRQIKSEFTREYIRAISENHVKTNWNLFANSMEQYRPKKIGIVTSNSKEISRSILKKSSLKLSFFDAIVTCDDVKHQKPHPEPYLLAAQMLKVQAFQCLVFEDSDVGVQSAIYAGMRYRRIKF